MSTLAIGAISSLQSWTRVVGPYGWAWMGDHTGQRVVLIRVASLGCVISALALLWAPAFWPIALVTVALFMCNGAVVPLYETSLAQWLTREGQMDAGRYGRVRMWGSVGFIVSVTVFGVVLEAAGVRAFPWIVAAMNALLLWAALRLPRRDEQVVHDEPAPAMWPLLRQPQVAWFFASIFFTVLAHTTLYAFLSLYLVSLGYGKAAVGALWAVSVGVEIAFFWLQGRLFPRWPAHRWLELAAALSVLRFAATAAAGAVPVVLVLAQLTHAVTFAGHHASCIALIHRLFPGRLRARGQALYSVLGYGLSGVIGGFTAGWLIEHQGFEAAFWASAGCGLVAWVCARRFALRTRT